MAGVFLGINNFFLGFISSLGINAATEFSIGALTFTLLYKLFEALRMKAKYGEYFPLNFSNFMQKDSKSDDGAVTIKWVCVLGLFIRTSFNISFQIGIIIAFQFAGKA
jgi:hypothetical protein